MTQQHPITPSHELVQQWQKEPEVTAPFSTLPPCVMVNIPSIKLQLIATRAAQWGADQELEACCEWIHGETSDECFVAILRAARRPKPPSLKEQTEADIERERQEAADQELDACCEWLDREGWSGESRQLRAARRLRPPSLKEQALELVRKTPVNSAGLYSYEQIEIIRRALESIPDPT
jgi:hypothetical protein